jgi:hypothetical protein
VKKREEGKGRRYNKYRRQAKMRKERKREIIFPIISDCSNNTKKLLGAIMEI